MVPADSHFGSIKLRLCLEEVTLSAYAFLCMSLGSEIHFRIDK